MNKRQLQARFERLQQDFLREKALWTEQTLILSAMLGITDSLILRIEQLEAAKASEPPIALMLAIQGLPVFAPFALQPRDLIESFELFHQSVGDALQRERRMNEDPSSYIDPDFNQDDDDPTAGVPHDQGPNPPSTLPFAAAVAE